MDILFVAATKNEIKGNSPHKTLITGIGMLATAIAVTHELSKKKYDLVINAGIAGAFDRTLSLGEVVEVTEDVLSELGVEDDEVFKTFDEVDLEVNNQIISPSSLSSLKSVRGITVNTVHGNEASIEKVFQKWKPQVESMEGAACMIACQKQNIPCIQIRAISNYVEKRNKAAWDIPLAIENLNKQLEVLLGNLKG
jgi:futalosine hydrolase